MVSKAVDETRKLEMKGSKEYKRTRWFWLKNPSKLTEKERAKLAEMLEVGAFPKTGKAYGIKLAFQELFKVHKSQATLAFFEWITMAFNAKVEPITKVAVTFFNARDKILSWFESHISNGILEGLHSVLQARKNAARGYRNTDNLITMSYLLHGKLNGPTHTK